MTGYVFLFLAAVAPFYVAWVFWPQITRAVRSYREAARFVDSCRAPQVPGWHGGKRLSRAEERTVRAFRRDLEQMDAGPAYDRRQP